MLYIELNGIAYRVEVYGTNEDFMEIEIYDTWNAVNIYEGELILDNEVTLTNFVRECVDEWNTY